MKTKTAFITGLMITCSVALQAQEFTNPEADDHWIELQNIGRKNVTVGVEVPLVYKMCCRTNDALHHASSGRIFSEEASGLTEQNWIENTTLSGLSKTPAMAIDYQLIPWLSEKKQPALSDEDTQLSFRQTSETESSTFDNFTGNSLEWILAPLNTNEAKTVARGKKKPAQIILIDPVKTPSLAVGKNIQLPVERDIIFPPEHVWYEWFNPELILTTWVEYWFKGSNEDNPNKILLVRVSF